EQGLFLAPCYLLLAAEEGTTDYTEDTERLMRLGTTKKSKRTKAGCFGVDAARGARAVSCSFLPASRC
ncbi:MAG: hypothetical protein MUF31_14955, partial [Akkermansiaceae bacterium]|nr:hypothetical protein [Akkermansiaceae bacterium]